MLVSNLAKPISRRKVNEGQESATTKVTIDHTYVKYEAKPERKTIALVHFFNELNHCTFS